jgi:hypothetical protein
MQMKKNVIAAVAAAIGLYLEAEQQFAVPIGQEKQVPEAPARAHSLWVTAGRQSTMEMRRLFQLRFVR